MRQKYFTVCNSFIEIRDEEPFHWPLKAACAPIWAQECPLSVGDPCLLIFLDCQGMAPPIRRFYKPRASGSRFFLGVLCRCNFNMWSISLFLNREHAWDLGLVYIYKLHVSNYIPIGKRINYYGLNFISKGPPGITVKGNLRVRNIKEAPFQGLQVSRTLEKTGHFHCQIKMQVFGG